MRAGWWLALTMAAAPAGAEPWRASLEFGGEVDSNVAQVTSGTADAEVTPLLRGQAELRYHGRRGPWRSSARGLLGLRNAVAGSISTEDVITAGVDVAVERDAGAASMAVLARATHYDVLPFGDLDDTRAYASSGADLGLRINGEGARWATLTAGVRRLRYKPDADFDWSGPALAFTVGAEVWQGSHDELIDLRASYRLESRGYRGTALVDGCGPTETLGPGCVMVSAQARADLHHSASVEVTYTGEQILAASYQLIENDSSSFGRSLARHRVSASATIALPDRWFATGSLVGQLDRYADPLVIPSQVSFDYELVDEENRSAASLRFARSLSAQWQLEARAAFYANLAGSDEGEFRRSLVYGGLMWEGASGAN